MIIVYRYANEYTISRHAVLRRVRSQPTLLWPAACLRVRVRVWTRAANRLHNRSLRQRLDKDEKGRESDQ